MIADYIKVENVSHALQALDQNQPIARVLAGGTDIMQKTRAIRRKKSNDIIFIDIKEIEELKGIHREDNCLIIGPATTLAELMRNDIIAAEVPDLIKAAGYVGSMELRNRATVGGNICTKNPAADLLVPLMAQDASIEICDLNGRKEISLEELLDSRLKGLGRKMLITSIKVPVGQTNFTGYRRWTRESMGRAYLSVMVNMMPAIDNYQLKIVITGASLWPRTFDTGILMSSLLNKENRAALIKQVILEKMGPADDELDTYQLHLAQVLLDEALDVAVKGVK